jgi:hypothetical protein
MTRAARMALTTAAFTSALEQLFRGMRPGV